MKSAGDRKAAAIRGLGGPALRTFFNVAEAWGLSDEEQMRILGIEARSTLQRWRNGRVQILRRDTVERISYVFGIYKAINILLPERSRADGWMRRPDRAPLFAGQSAIQRMTAGNVGDLYVVRQYLDSQLV
ncbi:antitoxin Xre-like helix-turn-helix domain-containing protein [Sphingomonas astaxanthinifaciens]|uniref:Antitoxin Xre/MbcA/ParS-like toxin-binding domain-containing protein n=1 Tax=Sphingomonas astaxanthinifaciens DSM 22298 TaxID=1123267 RepID=A0ABQ5Z9H9_9SPHN|nr:antitoxin Xre-like helix-turn-helix domain-containing protein [Sphingomonas astaxanthinifaciens]GLR48146.1 hypothetical protein GCM10007925_18590 [Sphingomonas astaxanthinifaciens DSM 22298]